jgi:hypothetical protein
VRNLDRSLGDGGMPLREPLGVWFERYGEGWAEATWTPTELTRQVAYVESTVSGPEDGVVSRAMATILLRRTTE